MHPLWVQPFKTMEQKHIIINIGRQFGSCGKAVADELGRRLGIPVYDRELLSEAAKKSGFRQDLFESSDERHRFWAFGAGLNDSELFKIQSDTIRSIAEKGSAIFVGRASDYVLRDMKCLDVFISAPYETRVARMKEELGISQKDAEYLVLRKDRERQDYYNFFTFTEWGVASNYDLCINSAILGVQGTAEMIIEFGKRTGLI